MAGSVSGLWRIQWMPPMHLKQKAREPLGVHLIRQIQFQGIEID